MFESRKKIRQINQALENNDNSADVNQLVEAIKENQPAQAREAFTKDLKFKLLAKHQAMTKHDQAKSASEEKKFSLWSDFRIRGLAMAVGLLALVVLGGVISYPLLPAPMVQGYILKNSIREISVNAPFNVSFTQLMDNSSVEKAFKIDPVISGKFSWSGNTMSFLPDQARKIGETYQISIGNDAQSVMRKRLEGGYSEVYKIVKTPELILFTPNDGSAEITADSKITMMFDRPMIELTTLEQSDLNVPNIKIEPAVKGRLKWLGTSALEFAPEKLALATKYTVTIPMGVKSVDGGSTEKEFTTSFSTILPVAQSYVAMDSQTVDYVSPNSKFKVTFNQKVDLASAGQLIKLEKVLPPNNENVALDIRYFSAQDYKDEAKRSGELLEMSQTEAIKEEIAPGASATVPASEMPKQEELEKSLVVTPKVSLENSKEYFLNVKAGLKGAEGPLGTAGDANYSLKVLDPIAYVNGGSDDAYSGAVQNLSLMFNAPVDLRSFKNKVHLSPISKDSDGKEIQPTLSIIQNEVDVSYDYKPVTKYTVSVDAGITDIFGNVYNKPVLYEFTSPSLRPDLELKSGTDITVVDGSKPSLFYVSSVNISSVDVKLKKLNEQEFMSSYSRGYVNNDVGGNYSDADFQQKAVLMVNTGANERGVSKLDLDSLMGAKLAPGFYYLRVSNDKVRDDRDEISKFDQMMIVSKSSLAVKLSEKQMLVWATDMASGQPVSGMNLRIISDKANLTAVTDANGLATVVLPDPQGDDYYREFTVIGDKDSDLAFVHTSWSDGVAPWNFNINSEAYSPEYYSYLYTDRPIYRPAQEIFFKGIVRKDSDKGFKLPDISKSHVTITDPNGNNLFDKELDVSANGSFSGTLQLGENISTGDYSITASLVGAKGPDWANQFSTSFKVNEYRKPDYKLDITPEKQDYINGETAKLKVSAGYFFGAPLPKAKVTWTVKSTDYYFGIPEELASKLNGEWFSFAEEGFFCYWGCQSGSEIVTQGSGVTDDQGNYEISLPLQISDKKMSQLYSIEANVSDANNQSVSNRSSIQVHKGETYLGIRSSDYVLSNDKPAKFQVLSVNTKGEIVKGANAEVALYKRDWNTIKRKNVDSGYYYENNYEDKLVETQKVRTGDDGLADVQFSIKDGGSYKVEASLKDSKGNLVKSSTTVYVSSDTFINWGSENNDKLELVTDKTEYKVGDIAKVMIKSPYKGVYALVTYEKNNVFGQKVIKLNSNSETIEIPVTEKFLPNAFVSVVLVKGNQYDAGLQEPTPGDNDERQVAAFKVGYATLQVNTSDKKLNIEISSDKPVYGPKDKVKLTLKTTDKAGKPVAAELSVGVVDESVLSLTESVTADLLNVFYRQRMLGVSLAETLTKAISRVNVQVEAGMKGGGGGGLAKRGLFKDTAHFESVVKTDASGNATVEFELPDNLTTWQVMAIGITDDKAGSERTLVGSNKYNFLVNKDILVRPALPRFLSAADEMTVSAIVHNYTGTDQTVGVELKTTGVDILDGANRSVTIKSKSSEKLNWKIKVGNGLAQGDSALFDFKAMAGSKGDEIEQTLKIHQASLASNVATSKVITDVVKDIDKVWLPVGLDTNFGKLTISISPTLAGTINKGLEYLVTYPYGCSEQLASSILPNLALKHLIDLGKFDTKAIDKEQLRKNVEAGLQAIYKNQHPNGGFGLWMESDPNEWVTAYVLNTMYLADQSGYTVDKQMMAMAGDYLNKSLKATAIAGDEKVFIANSRAYSLFVLSEIGQGDLGLMNNLDESRSLLGLTSRAYLAMSYKNILDQNKAGKDKSAVEGKVISLEKEFENAAKHTERGVNFEENQLDYRLFETNTSTTATVMKALNRIDPSNALIPKILQALLMEKQGGGHYASTQETAVTLLALIEYLEKSNELSPAYEGVISINGKEQLKKSFTSNNLFEKTESVIDLKNLLSNNMDNEISAQKTGNGKMYVDMDLEYYLPLLQLKARNEGIEVAQEYYSVDDTKMERPLSEAKVGQNLKAKMTIIVPEDRQYVMIEDYLPAGLEGIDFSLKTSEQNLNGDSEDCYEDCYWNWYFNHSEFRDDRVMYWADYLPKGVYEIEYFVRPTSIGNFADLPAVAQETYFPEVFGRSGGRMFKVTE